LLKHY